MSFFVGIVLLMSCLMCVEGQIACPPTCHCYDTMTECRIEGCVGVRGQNLVPSSNQLLVMYGPVENCPMVLSEKSWENLVLRDSHCLSEWLNCK